MKKKTALHIGCSGWNYDDWKGRFYSRSSSSGEWFSEYSLVFETVEINNTFYKLPSKNVFKNWKVQAPKGFIYSVKANRFITHMKKLKGPFGPVKKFLTLSSQLGEHLGPILFQLPPNWNLDLERFSDFTGKLPSGYKYVFEFRNESWYDQKIYKMMEARNLSMCLHDMPGSSSPLINMGPMIYVRLHGEDKKYAGRYSIKTLRKWAKFIRKALKENKEVFVYFNNDAEANAPKDALRLIKEVTGNA